MNDSDYREACEEIPGCLEAQAPWTGPAQLATVKQTLNRMTPLLCQSISRIAFASFPEMKKYAAGAVLQAGEGHLIMINTASSGQDEATLASNRPERIYLNKTLIHESGLYGGAWPDSARTLADRTIDHVRVERGFGVEWKRVHESFVALTYMSKDLVSTGYTNEYRGTSGASRCRLMGARMF